jgi:hypothetical protein
VMPSPIVIRWYDVPCPHYEKPAKVMCVTTAGRSYMFETEE